jgi:putative RNA 2'-phosphotransferase
LTKRRRQIKVDELNSMLVYMLGHNPAEFGIVPSREGFVAFKDLLKALHEEPGWRYVCQSHINEVLLGKGRFLFEIENGCIKTRERNWKMDLEGSFLESVPRILFTPVRRRAHPVVLEKGMIPAPGKFLVLLPDEDMALRIGRRQDPKPVLLRVEGEKARKEGVLFYLFDSLYLCEEIPARYIAGPPLPEKIPKALTEKERSSADDIRLGAAFSAGTFSLDLARDTAPHRRDKGKKQKGWKETARKMRRRKG